MVYKVRIVIIIFLIDSSNSYWKFGKYLYFRLYEEFRCYDCELWGKIRLLIGIRVWEKFIIVYMVIFEELEILVEEIILNIFKIDVDM